MSVLKRQLGPLIGVLLCGCAHAAPVASAGSAPWPGFGRDGCFAGPSLVRGYNGPLAPGDSAAMRGPWLVLSSLTRQELRQFGVERRFIEREMRTAVLVERGDSVEQTSGQWVEVPPDSVAFREGSTFPSVDWRLKRTPLGLEGEGVVGHDMIDSRTGQRHVSRWPVLLVRVSCAEVPAHPW